MSNRRPLPGALEASAVDQHLVAPMSGYTGTRGSRPRFGAVSASVPEQEWPVEIANAATELAKCCRASILGAKAERRGSDIVFAFSVAPNADVERLYQIADRVARRYGVSFFEDSGKVFFSMPHPDWSSYGKLYAAEPYAKPRRGSSLDAGVVLPRTGWSGYRGARDPFPSSIVGEEVQPSDYSKFGADSWHHGKMTTPMGEYEGPGATIVALLFFGMMGYSVYAKP